MLPDDGADSRVRGKAGPLIGSRASGCLRVLRRLPLHRHGSPIQGKFSRSSEPSTRPLICAVAAQPSLPRNVNVPLMSVPDTAAANVPDISVDVNSPVSEAADWVMETETGCSTPLLDVTPRSIRSLL